MKKGNNNQTTTSDQTCNKQSETDQPGRTYASITRTESSCSTASQIYRATQERAVLLSPGKFIEKVMQEFQKQLVEFTDKMGQLLYGLVVTESMQWKEKSH